MTETALLYPALILTGSASALILMVALVRSLAPEQRAEARMTGD